MKYFATLLLLIGFAGMAIFGLFVMDFAMGHGEVGCIASNISGDGGFCPLGALEMAFHHIDAFQAFSLTTAGQMFGLFLLLSLFVLSVLFWRYLAISPPVFLEKRLREKDPPAFEFNKLNWLSLLEHSPSAV
ncbi:MAG: hypothetical protein WCT49_04540 [Candidatus Paceibacterota bacterium]|jgi:hypothetical protein|nr:hypothetical protein [Candidatus Paceibacterota bacterium]